MEQKLFNWNQLFGSNQLIQTKMYSDKTNVVYSTTGITFTIWGNEADFLGPQIFLMQKWRARESSASVWRMNRVFIEPKKKIEYISFFGTLSRQWGTCITCLLAKSILHTIRSSEQNYKCICHYKIHKFVANKKTLFDLNATVF